MSEPEPEPVVEVESIVESEPAVEPVTEEKQSDENSHLFSVRTTGGQEKIVMRMLEARMKLDQKDEEDIEKAEVEWSLYDSTKLYGAGDKIKIS